MSNATQQNRQASNSVEPSTTVDPSQVYDNRAELQRKAQIDAEKRRKYEAEQAAKKAEEARVAEETKRREEEEQKKKEEEAAAKKAEEQKRKNEQRRKAREDKKQSKNAATALQRLSSGNADAPGPSGATAPVANDEEAEMRAMFQKMREFNAKNPAMLAKLWEEERSSHEATKATPTPAPPAPVAKASVPPPKAASNTSKPANEPASAKAAAQATAPPVARPAPAVTATTTTTGAAATSLWPPHKKGVLAEATAKWLMSLPSNTGKSIGGEDVRKILDLNPSYVQLCESLEAIGLVFDRSTLARELLRAVPDGMKTQTVPAAIQRPSSSAQGNGTSSSPKTDKKGKQKANNARGTPSSTAMRTVEYEAPGSLADVAREVNAMHKTSFSPINAQQSPVQQSPYFAPSFSPVNRDVPLVGPNASRTSLSAAPSEVKPIIKQEEPRRPPGDKEEAARKRTFGDLVDLTTQDDSDDDLPPPKKLMTNPPTAQPATGSGTQNRDPLFYLQKPTAFKEFMEPNVNEKGQDAAQQANSYHQPQAAMHRPAVPSQPVQPPPKQKGPTPAQLQQARMRGKLLVEPIMRDRAARKTTYDSRTIARDVLLATGRHPDMRGLNSHLAIMQKLLGQHGLDSDGGNRSDLATIRWDVIDPEPAKKPAKDGHETNGKENQTNGASHPQFNPRPAPPLSPQLSQLLPKSKKKPGRPHKYRVSPDPNLDPALLGTAPNASTSNAKSDHASPSTSNPGTPTTTLDMAAGGAVGYSAFHQVGADGKKKKGRPFGWRKSVHSREAQGLAKVENPYYKSRARPPTPAKTSEPVAPEYQVFKCGWMGCKSELHNADVLKKHIVKVHGKADEDGGLFCQWEGCEVMERRWSGLEAWLKHVDNVHLEPIRWKLGDGPREVGE